MVKDFSISLSTQGDHKEFLCGETISGLLHFKLTESKSYKYIEIKFYGGAQVRWTELQLISPSDDRGPSYMKRVTFKSKKTYVHEVRILWSSDQSPKGKIGPGTFDLPFQFEIPRDCLSSFEGSFGSISYALHGLIKTDGRFNRDHKIQVPIKVSRITDVNLPQMMMPVQKSKKKQVGFFCFGGDVEFTVSLSHTGFCIGHNLPLTVNVVNGSSRRIKMRAIIQRHCFYYAQGNNNYDKRELAAVNTRNIAPHSEQTMVIEDLVVPAGVEPSFSESQIIKMQYVLKVIAVIPWAKNFFVAIPITLGNVPFTDNSIQCCS